MLLFDDIFITSFWCYIITKEFLVPEIIETDRLLLRQFKETDWPDLHEYMSSKQATEYTMGRTFCEGET